MKKSIKIDAFTLTEILVVLVISAIVVGLAFSVLDLVQKNFTAIRDNFAHATEVQHLKQRLVVDFNQYHHVEYDEVFQEIRLKNEMDSISYNISHTFLIRNFDTLPVEQENLVFFYQGNEVSSGKVDALKILINEESDNFIFISKKNSAKTYFE